MKITTDNKEILTSIFLTFVEGYKIWLASLLAIFVPQYCPDTGITCSFQDNFTELDTYNTFVLAFNFFTLFLFNYTFYIQNKREHYIITHLDVDDSKGNNTLSENIHNYQKILEKIKQYNIKCYNVIIYTSIVFVLNTIFSSVLVFYFFYDGFRTVTTLIANVLLVSAKLYKFYDITKECIGDKPLALSVFRESPISYNVIDQDYA
jgi:hypothetical protein